MATEGKTMIKFPEFEEMEARDILSAVRHMLVTEAEKYNRGEKAGFKMDRLEKIETQMSRAIRDQGEK